MKIVITRMAAGGLSRERWEFSPGNHDGPALRLTSYGVERRERPTGRFSAPTLADRWLASDERQYTSGLPRPTEIPADVVAEAQAAAMPPRVFIGWFNSQSEYRT